MLTNFEDDLTPLEKEIFYYGKLLEISNLLKKKECWLGEFKIGKVQDILDDFRLVFSDCAYTNDWESSKAVFLDWFECRFKNLENQSIAKPY